MGLALGGGKTDRTSLAVVEYYPDQNKIFLSRLFEKIKTEDEVSADLYLHRLVTQYPEPIEFLAFDVPLQLPKCMRCQLKCPGYEACQEPEILWMWNYYRTRNEEKKPHKLLAPYTERCAELYLKSELEEPFHPPYALGANIAPLTARAHFITRRLQLPLLEVYPKLSLWRIGRTIQIEKSYLRFHRHSVRGEESRQIILDRLVEKGIAFLYDQDMRQMTLNHVSFDAFLCALTAVLNFKNQCEDRPRGFPAEESWVAIPKKDVQW